MVGDADCSAALRNDKHAGAERFGRLIETDLGGEAVCLVGCRCGTAEAVPLSYALALQRGSSVFRHCLEGESRIALAGLAWWWVAAHGIGGVIPPEWSLDGAPGDEL